MIDIEKWLEDPGPEPGPVRKRVEGPGAVIIHVDFGMARKGLAKCAPVVPKHAPSRRSYGPNDDSDTNA